ncbi:TPA: DNA replication terminus site-binding protein [Pseudomonas aeruginosa]
MHERINLAHEALRQAIVEFNERWPSRVISGVVWRLPTLAEQKTPDVIAIERLEGEVAVHATAEALLAFELNIGQAPGTVMRLPGYMVLEESVLEDVRTINALKEALDASIEETRLELNMIKDARPRIMRRALGERFNTNQLLRKIQAFEKPPRKLTFTWAGHTAGTTRVKVGDLREKLKAEAQLRADRDRVAIEETSEWQELKRIVNMDESEHLVQYKNVAPHPRAMLWFSGKSRYDAMIHANLPVFLVHNEGEWPAIEDLKDFDREMRTGQRNDKKPRADVVARLDIFVPLPTRRKAPAPIDEADAEAIEQSTYAGENVSTE